jgi:hypothetical protein
MAMNDPKRYPQNVKIADEGLKLPKLEIVKAKIHRVLDGKLKCVENLAAIANN